MIETAMCVAINGDVPLRTGDVFLSACDVRFEDGDLKKLENPPIYENEIKVDLFVEAINLNGQWVDELPQGYAAMIHVLGENAKEVIGTKMSFNTKIPGQRVCIG